MFDWTPVLLGSPGDFLNISKHSIDISAIDTVKPFHGVEIEQPAAVHHDVVPPSHLRNSIDRETNELIHFRHDIHE